jgi:hypothetical protein
MGGYKITEIVNILRLLLGILRADQLPHDFTYENKFDLRGCIL